MSFREGLRLLRLRSGREAGSFRSQQDGLWSLLVKRVSGQRWRLAEQGR